MRCANNARCHERETACPVYIPTTRGANTWVNMRPFELYMQRCNPPHPPHPPQIYTHQHTCAPRQRESVCEHNTHKQRERDPLTYTHPSKCNRRRVDAIKRFTFVPTSAPTSQIMQCHTEVGTHGQIGGVALLKTKGVYVVCGATNLRDAE